MRLLRLRMKVVRFYRENWFEIYTCIEAKTTRTEMLIESEHEMWKTDIENKKETEIENENEKTNDTVLGRLTCTVEVLSEFLLARLTFYTAYNKTDWYKRLTYWCTNKSLLMVQPNHGLKKSPWSSGNDKGSTGG